ncbi:MAG TPA: bifunctional riboflavin kinase/FAD synthetase [Candidatus Acidoferrales bacterium]|nr:bifunctional riboflavin kinase/FAD synthetase [Candidatus Acidoferrales bacterium]
MSDRTTIGSGANGARIAVCRSAEEWTRSFGSAKQQTAVTIGNFDGVHLGHQKILRAVVDFSQAGAPPGQNAELISTVLTFYPHPTRVIRPDASPALLMTLDQRLAAFEQFHIHAALVIEFTRDLAQLAPESFVQRYLVDTLRTRAVFVGENFRFGHKQAGDVNLLRQLGERFGFETEAVAPVVIDAMVVSSTAIREAIREGRVDAARKLLGRPYALKGEIRRGTGMGTKFVVPTLNLATRQELLPKLGVYATEVILDGKAYHAATNVGVRPTFDGGSVTIESHLIDFNEARTGGPLEVRFLKRIRDEQRFPNPEALRRQILTDIQESRDYFQSQPAQTSS